MRLPVAIMARVPVAGRVKTRLCPPLTQDQAAGLARCFLQDRLEQLGGVAAASPLVAFTPADLEAELRGLLPAGVRPVAQEGANLGIRLDRVLTDLLAESGAGAIAIDTDSPSRPSSRRSRGAPRRSSTRPWPGRGGWASVSRCCRRGSTWTEPRI